MWVEVFLLLKRKVDSGNTIQALFCVFKSIRLSPVPKQGLTGELTFMPPLESTLSVGLI